jgi:hypothetical protein
LSAIRVAEGLAQYSDVEAQAALVHMHIGPHLLHELALVHHFARSRGEKHQYVEGAAANVQGSALLLQQASLWSEPKGAKSDRTVMGLVVGHVLAPPCQSSKSNRTAAEMHAPEREIPAGAASAQGLPPRRSNRAALFQTAVSLRIRRPRSCRIRSDCRRHCRIAGGGASRRSDAVALGRTLLHMFRGFSLVRARSRAWF